MLAAARPRSDDHIVQVAGLERWVLTTIQGGELLYYHPGWPDWRPEWWGAKTYRTVAQALEDAPCDLPINAMKIRSSCTVTEHAGRMHKADRQLRLDVDG